MLLFPFSFWRDGSAGACKAHAPLRDYSTRTAALLRDAPVGAQAACAWCPRIAAFVVLLRQNRA
jgi:hypothetical protein